LGGFLLLFQAPIGTLVRDWLHDPDASHGLLLAPLAVWLAWRSGIAERAGPAPILGTAVLIAAVMLRYVSGLAAELFTMRMSLLGALFGTVIFIWGARQIFRWWLPASLLVLSVPIPDVLLSTVALPLQLQASRMGAALLEWREVPVHLAGNVIYLPGQELFVTEACSGLRSLTALVALGLLMGGLWLKHPVSRLAVFLAAIPVAMVVNGFRVFLTGFLVYFVDPAVGEGFMHYSEGWILFVVAFVILGGMTWGVTAIEQQISTWWNGRRNGLGDAADAPAEALA
jgi:exosortase